MTTETTPAPVTTAQDTPQTDTTAPQTNDIPQAVSERGQELRKVVTAILSKSSSRARAKIESICKFLELVADGGFYDDACRVSGLEWHTLQGLSLNPDFMALRQFCQDSGRAYRAQYGERRAFKRAFKGTMRPVYQGGVCVGHVKEFSDKLAAMFLESFDPQRFRQSSGGGGSGQTNVAVVVNWSFEAPAKSANRAVTDITPHQPANTP